MDILKSGLAKLRDCFRTLFPYNTDGCIETIDSLSSNISAKSHIEITLNPLFTRSHTTLSHVVSSYYKPRDADAEESKKLKDEVNKNIQNTLCQHIEKHTKDYNLFAIDVTPYKRPHAKKVTDKGFVYSKASISSANPVVIGHKYSYVNYLTEENHWALPLSVKRVATTEKDTVVGVSQWTDIISDPANNLDGKTSVGVFDAAYSNAYAINSFVEGKTEKSILIARIRGDRVLMRPNLIPHDGKQGRPSMFDKPNPFKLKEDDTWGDPKDTQQVDWETKKGKNHTVEIMVWDNLRMRGHKDAHIQHIPLTVVRITVSDKDGKEIYKNPLWLLMVGNWPIHWLISKYWHFYCARFDIEHYFRFGKQRLLMVAFQTSETINEENWMQFGMVAYHQLYHARNLAKDLPRAWEKKRKNNQAALSPSRVQRDMPRLLEALPKITTQVKARGIPEGRKAGEKIGSRIDSDVVRKSTAKPLPKAHINIIWSIENNGDILKPKIKYKGIEKSNIPEEIMETFQNVENVVPACIPPPA
jgi:hypothetical protein